MVKFIFPLLLFLPVFWAACTTDDTQPFGEAAPEYGELELEVLRCAADCDSLGLAPVEGARIFFYLREEDLEYTEDFAFMATTDADGKLMLTSLENFEYWLIVQLPGTPLCKLEDYIKTPARTRAFHTVIFEK